MEKKNQFIALTCSVSWIAAGLAISFGLRINNTPLYTIFAMTYMLLPAICTIILQVIHKEKPLKNLNVSFRLNRWFLVAGITPIFYAFLTLAVNLPVPGVSFSFGEGLIASLPAEQAEIVTQQLSRFHPAALLLIQVGSALIAGCTINAFFALGEELGWRGYMIREMKDKKLLEAAIVIGVVWGLWHFPLILLGHNYPEHSVAGVGMMVIWCVLLSPVMTYITVKSKSVIAAAIFHGSLNAIAGIGTLLLIGGNDLTNGATGISGFISLLIVNSAFFLYDRYITKENIFTSTLEKMYGNTQSGDLSK